MSRRRAGPNSDLLQGGGGSFARSVPAFVGRKQQLEFLQDRLQEAMAGSPEIVLVHGVGGVGKTRLINEFRSVARQRGVRVCHGRSYEDMRLPYLPFIEGLFPHLLGPDERGRRGMEDGDAEIIARLIRRDSAASSSKSRFSLPAADEDRLRLLLAVTRATVALAQSTPALLSLDDLHWADGPTLELFNHLAFRVSDIAERQQVPLLIVGSYRDDLDPEVARTIARLRREDNCWMMEVAGLNEPEVQDLIQALGLPRPSRQLITLLGSATGGNPLFVQEALQHLLRQGALEERGGYLVTTASVGEIRLPGDLQGAIAARVGCASEGCRKVLTLVAFLGDRVQLRSLRAVSGLDDSELLDRLEEAIELRLLVSDGEVVQFAHPLFRQVLYSEPSVVRRQSLHASIARALERLHADRPDEHVLEIAQHLISAAACADPAKVVEYGLRAGEQAFRGSAWGDAARYCEAALTAAEATGRFSAQERAETYYRAGFAHYRNWDTGPCLDQYEKAILAFRESGDTVGLVGALSQKVHAHFTLASVPYGTMVDIRQLTEALEELGDRDPELQGRAWTTLSRVYWTARQPEKAKQIAYQALDLGKRIDNDCLRAEAICGLALAQIQSMEVSEALHSYQNALAYARRVGDMWLQGWPLQRIPGVLTRLGRLDEAEAFISEASEVADKTHDWGGHSLAVAARTYVNLAKGDFDGAERDAHEVMLMVRRSRYPWGGLEALTSLACARFLRGAWAEATDALDTLIEPGAVFEDVGPSVQLMTWLYRRLLSAHEDVCEGGQGRSKPLQDLPDMSGDIYALPAVCATVEIAACLEAPAMAASSHAALRLAAERGVLLSTGWLFLIPRVRGLAATLVGNWREAESCFDAAIEVARRVGSAPELGRSCLDYARMLMSRSAEKDQQRAVELVKQSSAIFKELGMEPFERRAERLAAELHTRVPAPRRRRGPPDRLSSQETAVLMHIARGRTEQQIADSLVLSRKTLARNVSSLMKKIGAGRQPAAVHGPPRTESTARRDGGAGPDREAGALPSLRIVVFTDMVRSTEMLQRLGDSKARVTLRIHNQLIRDCLKEHGGVEIKHTGDGFLLSFSSVARAIACTIAIQKTFEKYREIHPDEPIQVRIGINAGEPIADEGDLYGKAVNATARICARARPGEILVSEVVRHLVAGKDVALTDRGRVALRGFSGRFRLYAVGWAASHAARLNPDNSP